MLGEFLYYRLRLLTPRPLAFKQPLPFRIRPRLAGRFDIGLPYYVVAGCTAESESQSHIDWNLSLIQLDIDTLQPAFTPSVYTPFNCRTRIYQSQRVTKSPKVAAV